MDARALTFAGPARALDEFGVWVPVAAAAGAAGGVASLALAGGAEAAGGLLWRQQTDARPDLPAAHARLSAGARALPEAATRMAIFARAGGQVAAVAAERAAPEAELAGWARLGPERIGRAPEFAAASAGAAAFFEKVRLAARHYARVETSAGGVTVAATEVAWSGHWRAAWRAGATVDAAAGHLAAVRLALRTRDLWLRLAATVLRGAFELAALFAANPLLALPAAYRFTRQVIAQAQVLAAS